MRHTRPVSIGLRAVIALAVLLTSGALYGLAALSVRTSMRVIAVTAPPHDPECAGPNLVGSGGAVRAAREEWQ
jgi:hypothetical protein